MTSQNIVQPEYIEKRSNRDWYNCTDLAVEGQGWPNDSQPYTRLPDRAYGNVTPEVWITSRYPAGLSVRFTTDAEMIDARWSLSGKATVNSMPPLATEGLDLYEETDAGERWVGSAQPSAVSESPLISGLPKRLRTYRLYLPLFAQVAALKLYVPQGSVMRRPAKLTNDNPLCIYGTSIVHGASVSRPGMAYPAQLGRMLRRQVVGLGFSGCGKMEPAIAELLGELTPAMYLIDCLPNLQEPRITQRVAPFIHTLRKARPDTPIALMESIRYSDGVLVPERAKRVEVSNAALRNAVTALQREGVQGLSLLPTSDLLGEDGEGTADGTHPTDLGAARMATGLAGMLEPILSGHD